jgi:hypothetical protein
MGTKAVSVVPPRLIALQPHCSWPELGYLVDLAGIEPATSRTPSGRSPPELQALRYPLFTRHVRARSDFGDTPPSVERLSDEFS